MQKISIFFHLKIEFHRLKIFFKFTIALNLIDMTHILPMKPSESKNFLSAVSYDEKTAENYQNSYAARKVHSFQAIKDTNPKYQ